MRELLKARLQAAGVAAEAEQVEKLAAFHALLIEANARMNLTRVSADPAEAIDRNYLDSLSPLPHLSGAKTCVDVGSGAGFPGVPLAIFLPDTHFVLMDSLLKRVEFLRGVIEELSLNAEAVCLRAEEAGRGCHARELRRGYGAGGRAAERAVRTAAAAGARGREGRGAQGPGRGGGGGGGAKRFEALGGQLFAIEEVPIPGATGRTRWLCWQKPRPPRKNTPGAWACRKSARCDGAPCNDRPGLKGGATMFDGFVRLCAATPALEVANVEKNAAERSRAWRWKRLRRARTSASFPNCASPATPAATCFCTAASCAGRWKG